MIILNAGRDVEKLDFSYIASENMKVTGTWKNVPQVLVKLNIHLLHNPATAFLGIYPREIKTYKPV